MHFSQPFSGSYKGVHYCSDRPLARRFANHASCKRFSKFVSLEIKKRLITGAVRVWGKVGVSAPPHVVLSLTVEQLKSRIAPRQADPVLLAVISQHIGARLLQSSSLEPSQIFVLARDQALFKALFFAGDRAADLLQLKTGDILCFPDNSGFLLNHIWTKTLRSGDRHVFAFKWGSNKMVCPVGGLELYVRICGLLRIKLGSGYLFCPLSKSGTVSSQWLTSQTAQTRLKVYSVSLRQQLTGGHFTLHGFRGGAAVSTALAGVDLHAIIDHVGWKRRETAFSALHQVEASD